MNYWWRWRPRDVVEQEHSYGSCSLLWPTPKTFTILNGQFFSLYHMGNTVWACSSDWLYYVCGEEYLTWHSESCQVASAALRACAWLTLADGSWPASVLRWDCILPFQGACCMGFTLYAASEAPHLGFKNDSRELRLFHWELQTLGTSGEVVLFVRRKNGLGSRTMGTGMRTILAFPSLDLSTWFFHHTRQVRWRPWGFLRPTVAWWLPAWLKVLSWKSLDGREGIHWTKIVPGHGRSGCPEVTELGGEEAWDQRWGALLLFSPVLHFSPHSCSVFTLERI